MSLNYGGYDKVGNVGSIADPRASKTQTFTYDVLDRLKTAEAAGGFSNTFDYDAHGNRLGSNFVYNPANRFQLQSFVGVSMTYDENGNLSTGPNAQFWYTPDNLMDVAQVGGTTTRFAYDADTWRVKKSVDNGPTTYYVRGPNGELLMEWVNTSPVATVREYIYAGSRLIAVMKGDVPPK